jgi:glutaminase
MRVSSCTTHHTANLGRRGLLRAAAGLAVASAMAGCAPVTSSAGVARAGTAGPTAAAIQAAMAEAYDQFKATQDGANASYIPALAQVPSDLFGIAVVTAAGERFETGDTEFPFAIQSISKVFTMAQVMEEVGAGVLYAKVGAESTGLPFNSVMAVELHGGKPLSPLVNAGAMSTVSLLPVGSAEERWTALLAAYGRFAGHPLALIDEVYASEAATNFHNRGIAWLLYSYGTLYSDPMEACDIYTRQCSVAVTTRDLATMGATLAAGGVNPLTKERVIAAANLPHILAEMTMEGLYEASGDWAYNVGLPAKSGVGGGILAVAPGTMAIAAFAPPLDAVGNSVKAALAIAYIASKLGLNIYGAALAA